MKKLRAYSHIICGLAFACVMFIPVNDASDMILCAITALCAFYIGVTL